MSFTSYALIGSGLVARHMAHYLSHLNLPFARWSRRESSDLRECVRPASHILLAVSDPAIAEMSAQIKAFAGRPQVHVHFSGVAQIPGVYAAHPLMTFGSDTQSPGWYRAIPFTVDKSVDFSSILPGLPNAHFAVEPSLRPLYHALCALAGNSTFLLWQRIAAEFRDQLHLPADILAPFLNQVVSNALNPGAGAMATGPVARGDWAAVGKHLRSLEQNPQLATAYRQFLNQAALAGHPIPEALL